MHIIILLKQRAGSRSIVYTWEAASCCERTHSRTWSASWGRSWSYSPPAASRQKSLLFPPKLSSYCSWVCGRGTVSCSLSLFVTQQGDSTQISTWNGSRQLRVSINKGAFVFRFFQTIFARTIFNLLNNTKPCYHYRQIYIIYSNI